VNWHDKWFDRQAGLFNASSNNLGGGMENFLLGFCVGFGGATVVALFWFRGQGKEWLDAKKQQAADKFGGK